jgi:primosomal replication protein N
VGDWELCCEICHRQGVNIVCQSVLLSYASSCKHARTTVLLWCLVHCVPSGSTSSVITRETKQ